MSKHQSHLLHFYQNDKNNDTLDSPSEPYSPRCRTEDTDPNPHHAHPGPSDGEHQRDV